MDPQVITSTTSMLHSATNRHEAPTRQSRSCRLREGWRLSGSVSCVTFTRSSSISEVGHPLQYSTCCEAICLPDRKQMSKAMDKCHQFLTTNPATSSSCFFLGGGCFYVLLGQPSTRVYRIHFAVLLFGHMEHELTLSSST